MELDYLPMDRFAFTDPAGGKSRVKRIKPRQAITCIAVDHLQRVFVIYAWAGRLPTSKYKDKILEVYEDFQPRLFGIEANAMQQLFGDLVRDAAREKFGKVRFIGVPQPSRLEKDFRIRTALEPLMFQGRLFVPGVKGNDGNIVAATSDLQELVNEIRGFPTAKTKDIVDALASAVGLVPKRMAQEQQKDELDALAAHLRQTNLPAHLIKTRLQEVRAEIAAVRKGRMKEGANLTIH